MNRLALGAALAFLACATVTAARVEAREVSLQQAAADLGYTYAYLGPEDAVSLAKPGVTILIRPGQRLFDVNDRTEAMDGSVPRVTSAGVFVSDQFVTRLRAIAARYATSDSNSRAVIVRAPMVEAQPQNVTGVIADLAVTQLPGTQHIDVRGKAPAPNLPITITLVGTFSSEIPDVVLTRRQVFSGSDGRFYAVVSVAAGFFRGAYITVVASSVSTVTSASRRFEVKAPNGDLIIPADQEQSSIR